MSKPPNFIPIAPYNGNDRAVLGNLLDDKLRENIAGYKTEANGYTLLFERTLNSIMLAMYYGSEFDFFVLNQAGEKIHCKRFVNGFQFMNYWENLSCYGITQTPAQILKL